MNGLFPRQTAGCFYSNKTLDTETELCFDWCMAPIPKVPPIPERERTPVVVALLEIIQLLQERLQAQADEIARMKGNKGKPDIKPSSLEKDSGGQPTPNPGQRPGSAKRSKTAEITIHETKVLKAPNVPPGSEFKGFESFTVQGLVLEPHNILYQRERWETPEGKSIVAPLPQEVEILGGHFDLSLIRFVLYQYYQAHVTQPLILEQLRDIGVDISAGQVNRIITEGHDDFHREKDEILRAGLEVSGHINVDDTGARHRGKNGYCTHIGNDLFAWFQSTDSKSRINFLELLRAEHKDYILNGDAMAYLRANHLPQDLVETLEAHRERLFANETEWKACLNELAITDPRHVRIATEGALAGSVWKHGFNPKLAIVSDDAGQFNIFLHALCWIHAERTIHKLVGFTEEHRAVLENVRTQIWDYYQDLKAYKTDPSTDKKAALEKRFDEIFAAQTAFATLNQALRRLHKNKAELLLVLDRPDIPLHNNTSEGAIRDYVKKRKISGSTRSDLGRMCRDTFASLKKTCRKLGISFWEFLNDRLSGQGTIPPLPDLIRCRAGAP